MTRCEAPLPAKWKFSGNEGTWEQASNGGAYSCSHLLERSGNVGTQLCSFNSQFALSVPTKKTLGTKRTSVTRMVTGLFPSGHVPTDFEIRRVNKGGVSDFC